ncbi:hypothetical protein Nepgr_026509 [Nepenthes gracilis]|uniref:Uncharacterized protein n=1 Tax=Nepenthes gracilis TaxID=150966 RepID=A0AAD3T9W2_NEPGR|nr:hypothetical protein Nepgr_026509 [Nepenthes gracilis]
MRHGGDQVQRVKSGDQFRDEQKPNLSLDHRPPHHSGTAGIDFTATQPAAPISFSLPFDASAPAVYHQALFHHIHTGEGGHATTTSPTSGSKGAIPVPPPAPTFYLWPNQSYYGRTTPLMS